MHFEFQHIDDYEILIPWEKQREGRDFSALIDKHFPQKKDLIFCLIEMVSLSDLDAIGETYLYSTCSKKESKEILDQYKSIVKKVISHFSTSISEYHDWYRRNSYILLQKNDLDFTFPFQPINWEQSPDSIENELDRSQFGKRIERNLKESEIQEYLQYYADLMHNEFGFKEYPNYCIVVRPISVIEGKEVIPLGNLYLHFATMIQKEDKFYLRLINDFLIVWFKRKGIKLIREIQHKTISDFKQQKEIIKDYLPCFNSLHPAARGRLSRKLMPVNKSLEEYYDYLFSNESLKAEYQKRLEILREYIIPKFTTFKEFVNQPANLFYDLPEKLGYGDKFFGIQGQSILCASFNPEHFVKTLLRREFFMIGLIVFDIDPIILRNILMDSVNLITTQSSEADYTYLWTELFIPWIKSSDKDKLNNSFLKTSDKERMKKRFIEKLKFRIKECLSKEETTYILCFNSEVLNKPS